MAKLGAVSRVNRAELPGGDSRGAASLFDPMGKGLVLGS